MMEICSEAIDLCAELVGTTNPNVVSDLGIAALTLKTAMQSAWLNVLINLSSLKDKAFRDECCQKARRCSRMLYPSPRRAMKRCSRSSPKSKRSAFSFSVISRRPPRQARAADGALFSFLNFCNLQ